ncbi:hypothetical protein JCM6882_007346 [Rhodosporidiobolus microsporus]
MFSTAQAGEPRGGGGGGGGSVYGHDSPYFTSAGSTGSTPSQHDSHFDPHDPAWFTPSLPPPSSSSAALPQGRFSSVDYPGLEGECEVLAYEYGGDVDAEYGAPPRRYSEGDRSVYSSSSAASAAGDRSSFLKSSIYNDLPSSNFFDSEYTLAPAAPLSSSAHSSSSYSPAPASSLQSNYSHSQASYPSTALQTPAHEQPSYPYSAAADVDVEMTFSPTSGAPSDPAPWMYDYAQPHPSTKGAAYSLNPQNELGGGSSAFPADAHIVESQQNGAYSLNVVSTTQVQTYATTINYSTSPHPTYSHSHSHDGGAIPFPSSAPLPPPSEALFSAPSARSSTSSGVGPSPFLPQSGTSSACTSVHPTPSLQPSPFISTSTSPAPGAGKQRSSLSGPTTSSGGRRARRPSLAHAHTQATPELSVIHQGQEQLLEGLASPTAGGIGAARHHSFSGASGAGASGAAPYPSGTLSATIGQGGFSPYPTRHHHASAGGPPPSPYAARRRSSNQSLSQFAGPSASSPVSASLAGRRISAGPGGASTAPGTPSRLAVAPTDAGGSRTASPSGGVPFPPSTPTRRSFGPASNGASPAGTPHRASPASGSSSSSRRNNHLNLTISVDAASSLPPSRLHSGSGRGTPVSATGIAAGRSTNASPAPNPHPPYSPYSPFSPTHPNGNGNGNASGRRRETTHSTPSSYPYPQPPLASPSASRKRRFSAEAASTAGLALAQAQLRQMSGLSLSGYAGAGGEGPGGGVALKGLATTFEEDDAHHHGGYAYQAPHSARLPSAHESYNPSPGSFSYAQQQQQKPHAQLQPHPHHPNRHGHGQVPLDGTVGLGLEMGVEEMRLEPGPSPPYGAEGMDGSGGLAPAAFGAGMAYAHLQQHQQQHHQHQQQQQPFLHHSQSHPQLGQQQAASSSSLLYYPQSSHPHPHSTAHSHGPAHAHQQNALAYGGDADEAKRRLEDEIRAYLRSENRLELGERTVVVMSPKIAQRSYGTEKRLLAPPPLALLLGSSWWSTLDSHPSLTAAAAQSGKLPSPPSPLSRATLPSEVFISISTDKDPLKHAASMSWMAPEGKLVLERDEEDAPPISGRAVSKSLAVSVPGELNKDVSTTVRTVVSIAEPGAGDVQGRVWAMVPGRPITVISKPSKKKAITAGAVAGLTHGTLVSLYNRTKTYTGSTRYLCTSGLQSMFPLTDWTKMVGEGAPRAFAPNDIRDVRFTSKSTAWDAFIIYAVDLDPAAATRPAPEPASPTYPTPPPAAIPIDKDDPKPLYYNQTIVLQDLSTGVISPILIIRRCDAKSVAVGGGSIDDLGPNPADVAGYPVAPGEQLGEPVSQYRPIALEVFQDISKNRSDNPFQDKLPSDSFLGVTDDEVGVHQAQEKRTHVRSPGEAASQPITPTTPRSFAAMQLGALGSSGAIPKTEPVDLGSFVDPADPAAKMKRPRRTSSSNAVQNLASSTSSVAAAAPSRPPGTLAKSRKRGQSMTGLPQIGTGFRGKKDAAKIWTIPVGDHCVWSIVNVEVGRHTMYIPPSVEGGKPPSLNPSTLHNPLYSVPRPFTSVGPLMPTVFSVEWPQTTSSDQNGMIAIHGENLSQDFAVWVGDQSSPFPPVVRSPHLLLFHPPQVSAPLHPAMHFLPVNTPATSGRVSLVRHDGVVFLTPFGLPEPVEPSSPSKGGRSRRR